jgi:hypothetical protein
MRKVQEKETAVRGKAKKGQVRKTKGDSGLGVWACLATHHPLHIH